MTRISTSSSAESAFTRLMSAAPRGVAAKSRSSANTAGLRCAIASRAFRASASPKAMTSPMDAVFWVSAGRVPAGPISTTQASELTLEDLGVLKRPPPHLDLADDVFLRHRSPVTAVGAVVAVIAHDEVVALLNDLRTPVVVAAEFLRDVVVLQRDAVDVDMPVHDPDRVALFGDHALDEHLLGVQRVVEHHDVAGTRIANLVDELVDDQAVVIFERRRHAEAVDAGHLEAERDDQRRVDRGGHQSFHARDDFAPGANPDA